MAAKQSNTNNVDPILTLTKEAAESLEALDSDVKASYEYLKTLEELGYDTSRQRMQLDGAVKLRDAALKLFKK